MHRLLVLQQSLDARPGQLHPLELSNGHTVSDDVNEMLRHLELLDETTSVFMRRLETEPAGLSAAVAATGPAVWEAGSAAVDEQRLADGRQVAASWAKLLHHYNYIRDTAVDQKLPC